MEIEHVLSRRRAEFRQKLKALVDNELCSSDLKISEIVSELLAFSSACISTDGNPNIVMLFEDGEEYQSDENESENQYPRSEYSIRSERQYSLPTHQAIAKINARKELSRVQFHPEEELKLEGEILSLLPKYAEEWMSVWEDYVPTDGMEMHTQTLQLPVNLHFLCQSYVSLLDRESLSRVRNVIGQMREFVPEKYFSYKWFDEFYATNIKHLDALVKLLALLENSPGLHQSKSYAALGVSGSLFRHVIERAERAGRLRRVAAGRDWELHLPS